MRKQFLRLLVVAVSLAALVAAQANPLSQADIDKLLDGGVSPTRVATLVDQQGLDFDPDANYIRSLELRPNTDKLIASVKTAGLKHSLAHGDADLKAQRWPQAEQDYRNALLADPTNAAAHAGLGTALVQEGKGDLAIPELNAVLARDPNNAAAHRGLGLAFAQRKDYPGAITELNRAKSLDPNDALTHATLGDVLMQQGDSDGAIGEYSQASRLDPTSALARLGMARAFFQKGDLSGAENNYRYLLANDPKSTPANYGLGQVLEKKGDNKAALDCYRVAYTNEPSNEQYRASYEHLISLTVNVNINVAPPKPPEPVGFGYIHIFRPSHFVASLATWDITVDDRQTAKLGNGRHFTVKVPAGRHTVYTEMGKQPVSIDVAPDGHYYVQTELISQLFSAYVALTIIPGQKGQQDFNGTRPIEPERIYDHERVVEAAGGNSTVSPAGGVLKK
jgi:tetratricopeptide (TPR) repeat protein